MVQGGCDLVTLRIKEVEIQNFGSYGPYPTKFEVDGRGVVCILGMDDSLEGEVARKRSNGMGKTTLLEAIVWGLFGRTTRLHNPGDKVINWFTNKDCMVRIRTVDGWQIIRTRKYKDHADLLIEGPGVNTQSTNRQAQRWINNHFNLDFNVFVSSVFFGQRAKSVLELSDAKRKQTLETILSLDKYNSIAAVAKEKMDDCQSDQDKLKAKLEVVEGQIATTTSQLRSDELNYADFEEDRQSKLIKMQNALDNTVLPDLQLLQVEWEQLEEWKKKRDGFIQQIKEHNLSIESYQATIEDFMKLLDNQVALLKKPLPDLEQLHQDWLKYEEDRQKLGQQQDALRELSRRAAHYEAEIRHGERQMEEWRARQGEICSACGQEVDAGHVDQHVEEITVRLGKATRMLEKLRAVEQEVELVEPVRPTRYRNDAEEEHKSISEAKTKVQELVQEVKKRKKASEELRDKKSTLESHLEALGEPPRTPDLTMEAAQRQHDNLAYVREKMGDLKQAPNPYHAVLNGLRQQIEDNNDLANQLRSEIEALDKLILHYNYIRKAYRDRNRIKKLALKSLVPYLNHRIKYFEQLFKLDTGLQFTETLGTKWRRWGYEQLSGGECKRIDCALMFALYQTLIALYGQQTNFCCMDEIDGSLDEEGVEIFAEVLDSFMSDSDSPSALFLISHKPKLRSFFPNELRVIKSDTYSRLQT